VEDESLKAFHKEATAGCSLTAGKAKNLLTKVQTYARDATGKVLRAEHSQIEPLRVEAVTCMQEFMATKTKTAEELFTHIADSGENITATHLKKFIKNLHNDLKAEHVPESFQPDTVEEDKLDTLFSFLAAGKEELEKDRFVKLALPVFKVVKATMLGADMELKSKAVRRLAEDEFVAVHGRPTADEESGVKRVRCKALKDDATGCASISGNKGTMFLQPCPVYYICVKEATMTDGLVVAESKNVRKIATGEVVEVLEAPAKDPNSIVRVNAIAKKDGAQGWVSIAGNLGTLFLEPC